MEPITLGVLVVTALLTSILSGVLGMAGGIALLTVMLMFFPPLVAIPLHGVIQLASNLSRTIIQRHHVRIPILARYSLFLVPLGFLGLAVNRSLDPSLVRGMIGTFVLLATWRPSWLLLGTHPEQTHPTRRFVWMGAGVGFLNTTVGATGPLIAPFFLNIGLSRHAIIGSKAACQTAGHLVKLVVFGAAGFAFTPYLLPLLVLSLSVVVGTWIGSRILEWVNEVWFQRLYKGVLTVIALRLVFFELLELV